MSDFECPLIDVQKGLQKIVRNKYLPNTHMLQAHIPLTQTTI